MIITSQGFGHFTQGMNNQDFGIETPRMLLILDGCSGCKYSEIGTRLFAQLFSRKGDFDNVEKFEENVKSVFEDIISGVGKYYPTTELLNNEFIMNNLLFTIIAAFETEDMYIVKMFGDGYVITQNAKEKTSFLRFSYGKYPPYFAYKYMELPDYKDYEFKTFYFDKKIFPKLGIATDGIMPIAKGEIKGIDSNIINGMEALIRMAITGKRQIFFDDVTIATFGGEKA